MLEAKGEMKLWILLPREDLADDENPWEPWYDKAFGFVVRAATEKEARAFANEQGGDETGPVKTKVYRRGGDPWLDPRYATCKELRPEGEPGVILSEYQSTG